MAHKWYSLQTYAGSERSVKVAIENLIEEHRLQEIIKEVVVPTEDVMEMKDGKKKITERSLYSGYCFILIDLGTEVQHMIQSLSRVSGFIGESNHPTPLSDHSLLQVIICQIQGRSTLKFGHHQTVSGQFQVWFLQYRFFV